MRNILLKICFDGSQYHGFQVQKNGITIQSVLQEAVESVFKHKTTITGCSRTDAGVHAKEYYALTKTTLDIPLEKIPLAINNALPDTIAVIDAYEVPDDFHPRYSALSKTYQYTINLSSVKNPFNVKYTYNFNRPIDMDLIYKGATLFLGKHDFKAFMSSGSSISDTVRNIYELKVEKEDNILIILVKADGFLYNMVRIIAGTLLDVGSGKIKLSDLKKTIDGGKREMAGFTAPPHGLCLVNVDYGEENKLKWMIKQK